MPEEWEKIYTYEQIKRIQSIEIESLNVFKNICSKLNVDYFLYGGSLLGAIKFKGFVPWDDDLDIAMMRDDYERFIKLAPALLEKEYEIQHPYINTVTPYPYIKFRRKDTALVEYICHKLDMNHGVYFDIYPIDNIPDDLKLYENQHREFNFWAKLFYHRQVPYLSRPVNSIYQCFKYIIKRILWAALNIIPHSFFVNKMKNIMIRYNNINTKRQGNCFFPRPVNYFDGIYPLRCIKFEGVDTYIPKGYKINLLNRYGDINKMPPKEERIGHVPYILKL